MGSGSKVWGRVLVWCVCLLISACAISDSKPELVQLSEDGNSQSDTTVWVRTLVSGLQNPWGMDFLPDGELLLTEKTGGLKRINLLDFSVGEISGMPATVDAGQGGMMDVLVHPDFADNGMIYLSYAVEESGRYRTRVMKARLQDDRLVDQQVLFTAQPFFAERRHFGSRLLIDGGYLYLTVGDRGNRDLAQSLQSHNGKVMRLHEDGTVPEDNPFVGREDARPEIWSYGHRNPQGIARHPVTGDIWVSEHGPQGGDEINRVERGANYGWPLVTYGEEYGGGKIGQGTELEGTLQPLTYYVPSIGTGGIDFYVGNKYPGWKNSLLVAGLRLSLISRVELQEGGLGKQTKLLMKMRVRDVQVGPDGLVYALADGSSLVRLELGRSE